jgi:hypothetical protein
MKIKKQVDIELQPIIGYLLSVQTDPFPQYILKKEILQENPTAADIEAIRSSKWYKHLADEQWKDGSWGRFHSMDASIAKKQKFVSTEAALGRMKELSLSKDDPIVTKCAQIMERYIRGEETWTDHIEKHKDNGKGHMFCRPFLTAARLNMIDPENPVIKPFRDVVSKTLNTAFVSGHFNEGFWEQKVNEYQVPSITSPGSFYGSMLLQNTDSIDDDLQRHWLDYIWNRKNGIYYLSSVPPAEKQFLEDKRFSQWLSTLELLSGFSLFSEFMKNDVFGYLLGEVNRLMNNDVELPLAHPISGHYTESWRDKTARKNDMILRILRVLAKC